MLSQRPAIPIAHSPPPAASAVNAFIREILAYPPADTLYQGRGLRPRVYNPYPLAQQVLIAIGRESREVCADTTLYTESMHQGHRLPSPVMIIWETCDDDAPEIGVDPRLATKILTCARPIFMFTVGLFVRGDSAAHMNLLIVNRNTREAERFEPHGKNLMCRGELTRQVDELLRGVVDAQLPGYRYVAPFDYCPAVGPQRAMRGEEGYCMSISTLYGHARMRWPRVSRADIVAIVMRLVNIPGFISHYIGFMHTKVPFETWDAETQEEHLLRLSRYSPEAGL